MFDCHFKRYLEDLSVDSKTVDAGVISSGLDCPWERTFYVRWMIVSRICKESCWRTLCSPGTNVDGSPERRYSALSPLIHHALKMTQPMSAVVTA